MVTVHSSPGSPAPAVAGSSSTGRSASGLPSLGLISHGTSSAQGQALIEALAAAVADDLRERGFVDEVVLGHVDVQQPDVDEVIDRLPSDCPAVLVPLLLSPGYHVHVDLAEALERAADRDVRLAMTLGPDARLAKILADRLPPLREDDEVVLAAAGSSDERANRFCEAMGELLASELGRAVSVGFLAGGGVPLKSFVEQNRPDGSRLIAANYLLAPGFFDDLARSLVTDPGPAQGGSEQRLLSTPLLAPGPETCAVQNPGEARVQAVPTELVDIVRDRVLDALGD